MGLTALMALAFRPEDEASIVALLNDEGGDEEWDKILSQPDFNLIREDHYEAHRVLEMLARDHPDLAALGTIVIGKRPVAEAGMGVQYAFCAEDIRLFATAYAQVSSDQLMQAIEAVQPEFAHLQDVGIEPIAEWMPRKFDAIRQEMQKVADANLAMIAGMT